MAKFLHIFLSIQLFIRYSACLHQHSDLYNNVFAYHNETYSKALFASEVVDKIYNSFRQWFFTVTFCEFTYFENRILKYIENYDNGYPVMLLNGCPDSNRTKIKPKLNRHGKTAYIVTSNEFTAEVSESVIQALKKTGVFKPRSAVIFVVNVPVELDSYSYYTIKNHFLLLWSTSITNSVLLLKSDRLRMFTYNPFFDEVRDITEVVDVSRLLSRQYNNLYGHTLRLSMFRKIYTSEETGPIYCDSNLAKTVVQFMNASCTPLIPRDGSTVGDLLENGTATGVTSDLIDGYSDLELNSRILKTSYYGYIDTTYPLSQDELCFLVRKSTKQSTFMTTIKLLSSNVLILVTISLILSITVTVIARKIESEVWNYQDKRTTGETIMDLVKCVIRQTCDFNFWGPVFRFLVLTIVMYSLIVDCVIDGIITSAVTYSRFKPDINTITELGMDTNLTLGVHNRHIKTFNSSISDDYYTMFKDRIEIFNDHKIKEVIDKRQFQYATLLRRTDASYISRKPVNMADGRPLFHVVPDCPVPCSIVYGLRYGSPYLPRLNYILHHLNQGGILQHWVSSEEYNLYRHLYLEENKERKPLNSKNLFEVFLVLLIGLLISSLAFVLEILVHALTKS